KSTASSRTSTRSGPRWATSWPTSRGRPPRCCGGNGREPADARLVDALAHPAPSGVAGGIRRPIDPHRPPDDPVPGHRAPVATVLARVAVVGHHEDGARRNLDRPYVLGPPVLVGEVRVGLGHRATAVRSRLAVDVDIVALDGELLPLEANDTLDEERPRLGGIREDDEITAPGPVGRLVD